MREEFGLDGGATAVALDEDALIGDFGADDLFDKDEAAGGDVLGRAIAGVADCCRMRR